MTINLKNKTISPPKINVFLGPHFERTLILGVYIQNIIVFSLNGIGTSRPLPVKPFKCPSNWTYHHHLKQGKQQIGHRSVALQVDLTLSVGSMEIPIPEDRCFCGREQNFNNVKGVAKWRRRCSCCPQRHPGCWKRFVSGCCFARWRGFVCPSVWNIQLSLFAFCAVHVKSLVDNFDAPT